MLLCQPQHEFRQSIYWGPHPSHRELLGKDEAEIQNGEGCVFGTAAELFRQHDVVQHFFFGDMANMYQHICAHIAEIYRF